MTNRLTPRWQQRDGLVRIANEFRTPPVLLPEAFA